MVTLTARLSDAQLQRAEIENINQTLTAENTSTRRELVRIEEQSRAVAAKLETLEQSHNALRSDHAALRSRQTELEGANARAAESLTETESALVKTHHAAAALEAELAGIEASNRILEAERERLTRWLHDIEGTTVSLRDDLSSTAGTLERAQARGAELSSRYEKLLSEKAKLSGLNESQLAEIERIRTTLEQAQGEVARLTNARGIYTVKPGDSLSLIAAFFYDNGNYWPRILEANQFSSSATTRTSYSLKW